MGQWDSTIKRDNFLNQQIKKTSTSHMRFTFYFKQSRIYLVWFISKFRSKTGENLKFLKSNKKIFCIKNFFESKCATNMFFHTSIQKNFEPNFNLQKTCLLLFRNFFLKFGTLQLVQNEEKK